MSAIVPNLRTVGELLRLRKFAIDDYQREYKWETKQIVELLDELYAKFSASYRSHHATREVARPTTATTSVRSSSPNGKGAAT